MSSRFGLVAARLKHFGTAGNRRRFSFLQNQYKTNTKSIQYQYKTNTNTNTKPKQKQYKNNINNKFTIPLQAIPAGQPIQNLDERDERKAEHEAKESTNLIKESQINLTIIYLPVTDSQSMSIVETAGTGAPKANPSRDEPWRCLLRMQSRTRPWRFVSTRCLSQ